MIFLDELNAGILKYWFLHFLDDLNASTLNIGSHVLYEVIFYLFLVQIIFLF